MTLHRTSGLFTTLGCALAGVLFLAFSLPGRAQSTEAFRAMNRPAKPFRVIANVYYVGASDIASYLIVTPQGSILLEGGFVETVPQIVANVRALGFAVEDIKVLLTSHAHTDHAGGLAELKRLTGARLVATAPEAAMLKRGGKGDFHYGDELPFPAVDVDRVIRDGETVSLGGVVLTARVTPGHTQGSTTWTLPVADGAITRQVVFMASLSTPGYDVVHNPAYPQLGRDVLRSVELLRALPCDVFLAPHGFAFGLEAKRAKLGTGPNPFIDPEGYRQALDRAEEDVHRKLVAAGEAWARGIDGQRKADLGNGTFLNPILAGDRPDPSVLKHGKDYYMVHSSFGSVPGLLIWHSRDLVNWEPIGPALTRRVGIVWAPDLSFCNGRFYIYLPVLSDQGFTNMVTTATDIRGPWSDPVDLRIGGFDPGHAVGADGKRYLFFNGGTMAPLADDGLSVTGPVRKVYDGWPIPAHWEIETFAQEGPKILRRGDTFYMVLAEGGTAGPATSHMVIMARSKNILGPWENSPYNPVVRTQSAAEKWWSKGHATLVEGPDGKQWYLVYHGYENGYYNLGRQTLLELVEWTSDGWVKSSDHEVGRPLPMPAGGEAVPHGYALSDDFSANRIGRQWTFFQPGGPIADRFRYERGALVLKAAGSTPKDSSPLSMVCGDQAYEIEVEIECAEGATGGLLLFYSERLFAGLGFSPEKMLEYWKGDITTFAKPTQIGRRLFVRLRNDHHFVSTWYSADGKDWTKHWMNFEVSGYHHNVAGGFLSLRPSLLATGTGEVRFRNFKYRALP